MINQDALISVVMSVYNGEDYLSESIESILNQTYKNFEFIIIDDGSRDKSLKIIKKYQKEDDRILIISRENKGLIASLNEGIEKANGKYIARMDVDDISVTTRFYEQIRFMENNIEVGVCGTWVKLFGDTIKNKTWKMPTNSEELKTRLLFSVPVAHPSVMMRKNIMDKHKLKYKEEYTHAEDYELWMDFFKYAKFTNIPKVLLEYRYLETSVSRVADNQQDDTRYEVIKKIFTKVLEELGINNTVEENRLHFTIALNERIAKENIDLKVLDIYLNKIIKANKKAKFFNEKYLKKYLMKKFLVVYFYEFKKLNYINVFTGLINIKLYQGIFNILIEKIKA